MSKPELPENLKGLTPEELTNHFEQVFQSVWDMHPFEPEPISIYNGWSGHAEDDPERYLMFTATIGGGGGGGRAIRLQTGIGGFLNFWKETGYRHPVRFNGKLLNAVEAEELKQFCLAWKAAQEKPERNG